MRTNQRLLLIAIATILMLPLPALAQKAPKPTNGTVSFSCPNQAGETTNPLRISLTVSKPGKNSLVNGNPQGTDVDGNHNFPSHTTEGGIGAYYKGLLTNAGWQENTDFTVSGGVINFYGITKLDCGVSKSGVDCNGSTDSKDVPFQPIPSKDIKVVKLERPGRGMDGSLALTGFGIHWNPNQTITTSTSSVMVHFAATDTALGVINKVYRALASAGWKAAINAAGELEITANSAGDPLTSLHHSIAYYSDDATEENDDHWIFTVVSSDPQADVDAAPR